MNKAMREKPDDLMRRSDTVELAKRLATHLPGNRTVWQVLMDTKSLHDGMTVEQAEKLLGSATEKTEKRLGWYFNPQNRHVAPCLTAKITEKGLAEWKLFSR